MTQDAIASSAVPLGVPGEKTDDGDVILGTHDLSLSYGATMAVDRLNLKAYRGQIYGFLGRNGAGKTSTIRMIMGIGRSDSGTIRLGNQTLRRIGNCQKRSIGYVSQEQFFYPWMTCQRIGRFVGGLFPTWDDAEFARLLNVLHLPADRKVSHLSGGMKVKLGLALALAHRPEILILDEPTAGLDPVARREFQEIIRHQSRAHGRTTFFSSHLIDEVQRVADRVGIIHRGQMRFEGPLEDLLGQVRQVQIDAPGLESPIDSGERDSREAESSDHVAPSKMTLATSYGLTFLRRGLDDPRQAVFEGTPAQWATAEAAGLHSSSLNLEDAFIALASDEVAQL